MRVPPRTDDPAGAPTAYQYLRTDSILGPVVSELGPREIEPADDIFARFVQSIVRQQISMAAAGAIFDRLTAACELTPAGVHAVDRARLRDVGLSERKIDTIRAVATAFKDRGWDRATFADMSDEAVIAELTSVPGVGVWTAKMQLMFALGRPDVFPVEDLGVRQGIEQLVGRELTRAEMTEIAAAWRPYRSIASIYIWELRD